MCVRDEHSAGEEVDPIWVENFLGRVADGDVEVVRRYLAGGHDPNITLIELSPPERLWRPLNAAVTAHHFSSDHLEIVRMLLAHDAEVDHSVLTDFMAEGVFSTSHEREAWALIHRHAPPELQRRFSAVLDPRDLAQRVGGPSLVEDREGGMTLTHADDHSGALSEE